MYGRTAVGPGEDSSQSLALRCSPIGCMTTGATAPRGATLPSSSRHLLNLVCAAVAIRSTGDRAWAFLLPLFLSEASSSLMPVSLHSLSLSLGVVLFGPPLAQWVARHRSQTQAIVTLVILENAAMALGWSIACGSNRMGSVAAAVAAASRVRRFGIALVLLSIDGGLVVLSLLTEKDVVASSSQRTAVHPLEANARRHPRRSSHLGGNIRVMGGVLRDAKAASSAAHGTSSPPRLCSPAAFDEAPS